MIPHEFQGHFVGGARAFVKPVILLLTLHLFVEIVFELPVGLSLRSCETKKSLPFNVVRSFVARLRTTKGTISLLIFKVFF